MENKPEVKENNIFIYDRKKAKISGAVDVAGFCETNITAECRTGTLVIEGNDLKIVSFDSKNGDLELIGSIGAVYYTDDIAEGRAKKKKGLFR